MMNDTEAPSALTIRPSRLKAFLVMSLIFSVLFLASSLLLGRLVGSSLFGPFGVVPPLLLASAFGLFGAIFFTPKEMALDEKGIRIDLIAPGPADYRWEQLEYYTPVMNLGLGIQRFKFEGLNLPCQVAAAGFRRRDWKALQQLLRQRFPEKRQHVIAALLARR